MMLFYALDSTEREGECVREGSPGPSVIRLRQIGSIETEHTGKLTC